MEGPRRLITSFPSPTISPKVSVPDAKSISLAKAREVLLSDDWIDLPTMFDFDEYQVMRRFCESISDERLQQRLFAAIRGKGAFGRFKSAVIAAGVQDNWYKYRNECLEEFAADWLKVQGIAYETE